MQCLPDSNQLIYTQFTTHIKKILIKACTTTRDSYFCDMRTLVRLVLLVFVFFLSTPTIVSVIKKSCPTAGFYNMSEEELAHKEMKATPDAHFHCEFAMIDEVVREDSPLHPEFSYDLLSARILIPPPEKI